jgi:hypothetical protein
MTTLRKAAQQALDEWRDDPGSVRMASLMMQLRAALEQPEQEPVAWRTFDGEGGYEYRDYDDNENYRNEWDKRNPNHKGWVEPLYEAPPPCPTCEALARTVMMDQTAHDTHPPRRDWRGLTEREQAECWYGKWCMEKKAPYADYARAIEAALKERNHDV